MSAKSYKSVEVRERHDIRQQIDQDTAPWKVRFSATTKDKVTIATYVVVLIGCAVFQQLLQLDFFDTLQEALNIKPKVAKTILDASAKIIQGATTIILILLLAYVLRMFFVNSVNEGATRFNLNRVLNLLVGILMFFVILSILFANWYAAVYSLGLISLVLGFALQMPITSFFAWILLIVNRPFRIGDRIKIGELAGDVIDIGYLTITIWETYGGLYSNDHPSGRIIKLPNSMTLNNAVINYSWSYFPYIWDELKVLVKIDSDLDKVSNILNDSIEEVLGHATEEQAKIYQELLQEMSLKNGLQEKPEISIRIQDNAWLEVKAHYLVHPQEAGEVKTNITKSLLTKLSAQEDIFAKQP